MKIHQPRAAIIVPAYNEAQKIGQVLAKLLELDFPVVVVDDGSPDETSAAASQYPVHLLRHACNLGQGAALQTGFDFALRRLKPACLVTFDADGQHEVADIPRLIEALNSGGYDVVLGSRFLPGGSAPHMRTRRRLMLKLAVLFTRLSTGLPITDTHNGLRALTAEAAGKIRITQNRMAHASEILAQIADLQLRWCEVPVTIVYSSYATQKGQSLLESVNILWDIVSGKMK